MKNAFGIVALLLLLTAGSLHTLADEPYTLRLGYQQGKSYVYSDKVRAAITREMNGQEMKSENVSTIVSRISVEKVLSGGSFSLVTQLDSLTVSSKSARRDTTMLMTDMMGKRSRVVLSALGKVVERAVIDSIKSPVAGMRNVAAREVIRFHALPEQAVAPGAKWTTSVMDTNTDMGGKMVTDATIEYTLVGKEEKGGRACVKITYTGTLTIEGKGSMMGMEMFTEGKGTLSGAWFFDPAAGITIAEEGQQETDATVALTGQQTMTMPITSSSKITRLLRSIEEMKK